MAQCTPTVLIVDNYETNRLIYREALAGIREIQILEAGDGKTALALARGGGIAMFIVDINMPDMDGFELASLLRQEAPEEVVPIVFVTTQPDERYVFLRGYRMGAIDFVAAAPVRAEILAQKARFFVQVFRRRLQLEQELQEVRHRLEETLQQQDALRTQATHDPLTQLPNRALFFDHLKSAFARARRARQRVGVAYIDLDGFKQINDRHGHATGDALLTQLGQRLVKAVRESDTVARLGGDEFALVIEGLDSAQGAEYVAAKAYAALTQALPLLSQTDEHEITVRPEASVGVAVFPDHANDPDQLLMVADSAMYEAKRDGSGVRMYGATKRTEAFMPLQLIRARQEHRKGK